jgi:RNA polymerase sigma-70 factor (ECF subfamily)
MTLPAGDALPPRRGAVLAVLALMFHTGTRARLRAVPGHDMDQADQARQAVALCWEAVRLARALAAHPVTASGDADALAALLLLHGARLTGAIDDEGQPLLLPGQARDRWDQGLVRLGLAHLQASQRAARLSRWHLLAGVAAEHAVAPRWEDTDWPTILRAYDALLLIDGSAAPRLAHAVARAEAGDAAGAYADLQALRPRLPAALVAHGLAALARAAERLGRREEAARWLADAAQAARHPADARLLQARRAALLS